MAINPEISVIIPCFGHSVELEACLYGLQNQQCNVPFEVIVVDSASDQQVKEVIDKFPQVRLIRSKNRLFPGSARNLGVREAASDNLAFLDADCIPYPDWIQQAYVALQEKNAIFGGPILNVRPIHSVAWTDNRLQFANFQRGRQANWIKHVPSCNMLVPKNLFDKLGGFREDLLSGEDVVFTSLISSGVWFNPYMRVYHHGQQKWKGFLEHQRLLGFYRGKLNLFVNATLEWIAKRNILAVIVILRRLGYITLQTIKYDLRNLPRLLLYLPLVITGLAVWTQGFYSGMRDN